MRPAISTFGRKSISAMFATCFICNMKLHATLLNRFESLLLQTSEIAWPPQVQWIRRLMRATFADARCGTSAAKPACSRQSTNGCGVRTCLLGPSRLLYHAGLLELLGSARCLPSRPRCCHEGA